MEICAQLKSAISENRTTSSFIVKHLPTGQKRPVCHLQCLDWTDPSIPFSEESVLGMIFYYDYRLIFCLIPSSVKSVFGMIFHNDHRLIFHYDFSFKVLIDELKSIRRQIESDASKSPLVKNRSSRSSSTSSQSADSSGGGGGAGAGGGKFFSGSWKRSKKSSELQLPQQILPNNGQQSGAPSPTLIHCCDGATRTGCFILLDVMLNALESNQVRLLYSKILYWYCFSE